MDAGEPQAGCLRSQGSSRRIVVDDFYDRGKADLYDLAIGTLDFDARRGQGLGSLHAAHDAADAMTIFSHDLDVGFAVERPQRRQGLGYFHSVAFTKTN